MPRETEGQPELVLAVVSDGAAAWPEFIEHYSPFILSCIRRMAWDEDQRSEIYVYVCERLSHDECSRIRQYRGRGASGSCKFTTWLAAVVYNLAREWFRQSKGRRRLFRCVQELEVADRLVFEYYFWEGCSISEISRILQSAGHQGCEVAEVAERLATIEQLLTRDQRWRLVASFLRSLGPAALDAPPEAAGTAIDLPDGRDTPSQRATRNEASRVLQDALQALPADERRALSLRYEQGLSARATARELDLENYKRVYTIQEKAFARMASELRDRGFSLSDFIDPATGSIVLSDL